MISQLEDLFGSLEFEDSGFARVLRAMHETEGLRVQVLVRFDRTDLAEQVWELGCSNLRTYELNAGEITSIEFVEEHPLLVPHTAKHVRLNFVGVPSSPPALVGELWEVHQELTEGWLPFDAFLNTGLKTSILLASGSGIIAEGPRPFLEAYAEVLARHGLRSSLIGEREPVQWRAGMWRPEEENLQALLLGDSYIIGRTWAEARRVS